MNNNFIRNTITALFLGVFVMFVFTGSLLAAPNENLKNNPTTTVVEDCQRSRK